jgi:hypothetical protein
VDFVATREDGSAVRLHPHRSKEAQVTEGTLEEWRSGDAPIYVAVHSAVQEAKRRQTQQKCLRSEPLPPRQPSVTPTATEPSWDALPTYSMQTPNAAMMAAGYLTVGQPPSPSVPILQDT